MYFDHQHAIPGSMELHMMPLDDLTLLVFALRSELILNHVSHVILVHLITAFLS
jgi:hypothetical protein